jgi:hypothetical protein
MEIITIPSKNLLKRKIWEIDNCFKCALIGTCINRTELRKLGREKIYQTPPRLDDYQLHVHFIRLSEHNDAAGKALHKFLEKKYRTETKKYAQAEDEVEIAALWEQDLLAGKIDSAWWAVLTHPHASADFVGKCYGRLHMISHDCTNGIHRDRQLIASLRAKSDMLEEVVGSERQHFRQERKKMLEENREIQQQLTESRRRAQDYRLQAEESNRLREQIKMLEAERPVPQNQQVIDDLRQDNNSLFGRIDELSEELELLRGSFAQATQQLQHLGHIRREMEQRVSDQAAEIASLETLLFRHISEEQAPCSACADKDTANCPGLNLCGKTVLYVGGLHKMVPHYRQLVEQSGGRFLHHDGGKEASRNMLPKLLNTADAVLCPIDCVSHDACNCVKKMCKRYQKPFVLMRSSGLSSLARGLNEIVQ